MKLSRDSWHYRYLNWLDFYDHCNKYSLCVYFWKVVGGILILPVGIALAVGAAWVLTMPLWWWFFDIELAPVIIAGVIDVGLLSLAWHEYRKDLRAEGKIPYKEPSLAAQWVHAKHRKICPLLDLE